MTKTEKNDQLNNLLDKIDSAKTEAKKTGKHAVVEALQNWFDSHPKLGAVFWHQYTPEWNDGSPCHFGISGFGEYTKAENYRLLTANELRKLVPNVFWNDPENECIPEDILTQEDFVMEEFCKQFTDSSGLESIISAAKEILELSLGDHKSVLVIRSDNDSTVKFFITHYEHS